MTTKEPTTMKFIEAAPWKDSGQQEWADWRWQARESLRSVDGLARLLPIPSKLLESALRAERGHLQCRTLVTPYLVERLAALSEASPQAFQALLKTVLPSEEELYEPKGTALVDGMGEDGTGTHDLLSQFYDNRVLLFASQNCPVHCRYCFRRRKLSKNGGTTPSESQIEEAIEAIRVQTRVDDVIISGGDPLALDDAKIERLLSRLRSIQHVKIIRIDTKFVASMPQRITDALVQMLRRFHPLYMTLHFVHPAEIAPEVSHALALLADAGIPLGSYTPLLRGINDRQEVLAELFRTLAYNRVRPYYLVHNIASQWTNHFTVSLGTAKRLVRAMNSLLSGIALPSFVLYLRGHGKALVSYQGFEQIERVTDGWMVKDSGDTPRFYPDVAASDER